jgi:hypothetical protein
MLADRKRAEEVRALLNELLALLREQNEMNWARGIRPQLRNCWALVV